MKKIVLLLMVFASSAQADLSTKMTSDLFLKNLAIQVQSFVTNSDGSRILEVYGSQQTSRFAYLPDKQINVAQTWVTNIEGLPSVYLTYNLVIEDDMSIHVDVAQYESLKPKPSGLIRKGSLSIRNFDSVSWVAKVSPDKNITIRFTPSLPTEPEIGQLKYPVMALTDAIGVDNANRLWTVGVGGAGPIIALGSPHGRLFLSFIPFKGSKEIGYGSGDQIEVRLGAKKMIWLRSREAIIGGGVRAKVFGLLQENVKEQDAAHPHSISVLSVENVEQELSGKKR